MPLFSVCIPAYNAENQIVRCLRSLSAQDFDDYEVVIVDDGSATPLEISLNQADASNDSVLSKTRIIRQANAGTYFARQTAMSNACGDYIFCMDADDALAHPHVLLQLADAIKASHPDVILFNMAREDGNPLLDYSVLEGASVITRELVGHELGIGRAGWNNLVSMVFRRELFSPCLDRPRLVMAEDRLQKAEVLINATTFELIDEVLYLYSTVPTSTMNAGFKPEHFYNRSFVESEMRARFQQAFNVKDEEQARAFLSCVLLMSLRNLRATPSFDFRNRIALYSEFREDAACNDSLMLLERCSWDTESRMILLAFQNRRMLLLDSILTGRVVGGRAKHALRRCLRVLFKGRRTKLF